MSFNLEKFASKTKVYDINMVEPSGLDNALVSTESWSERALHAISEDGDTAELEPEFIEALVAQEDADAMTVSAFESELEEFMQETPENVRCYGDIPGSPHPFARKTSNEGFLASQGWWSIFQVKR